MTTSTALRGLRLQELALVREVARQGSLARAAATLHLTQSAATKNLQALERRLGVKLFERHRRGLDPTEHGDRVTAAARRVLAEIERLEEQLEDLRLGLSGRVRVGVLITATPVLLPRVLKALGRRHRDLRVEIVEGTDAILRPRLAGGELDLVIGRIAADSAGDGLSATVLVEDDVAIVCRRRHPLAARRRLAFAALAAEDWILPPRDTLLRRQIDEAFLAARAEPPKPRVESVALSTNLALAGSDDYLLALPRQVFEVHRRSYGLVSLPLALPAIGSRIGYVVRAGEQPSAAAARFLAVLEDEAARLRAARGLQ